MIMFARNIKQLVSNNNQDLILQPPATTDSLFSSSTAIINIENLNNDILQWKRQEEQAIVMKQVVDVYVFTHIVNILKLYEAVKNHKEQIQQFNKYKPKKRDTKGWINRYLADQLKYSE